MTPEEKHEYLIEHIPYRLAAVDGLAWWAGLAKDGERPHSIMVRFERDALTLNSLALTNPLAEAGFVHCRGLFEFLGLKIDQKTGCLAAIQEGPRHHGDDIGIEKFGPERLSLGKFREWLGNEVEQIISACEVTLRTNDKGVVHFTQGLGPGNRFAEYRLCADTLISLVEDQLYRPIGFEIPMFRIWSQAQRYGI